jgi:2-polyprenyl-3-methyl-5-hydroxy-6-metoxy-1,4-benzoquinol methylase
MSNFKESIGRHEFDDVYDATILQHEFVEWRDYYRYSRERFWKSFTWVRDLNLGEGTRTLDIGGGIMAVLLQRLLGHDAYVGDVNERAAADVRELGLSFTKIDLFRDDNVAPEPFDLIVLTEVIEHIPQPPYLVFQRIARLLRPGGMLFLTTPNGHSIRNVLYMLAGREILDTYRYPEPGETLGHQHEYTMKQMLWQLDRGGFEIVRAEHVESGWTGATPTARLAHLVTKPATLVPHLRNGVWISARSRQIACA